MTPAPGPWRCWRGPGPDRPRPLAGNAARASSARCGCSRHRVSRSGVMLSVLAAAHLVSLLTGHPAEGALHALSGQVPCTAAACRSAASSQHHGSVRPRAHHSGRAMASGSRRVRSLVRKSPIREWTRSRAVTAVRLVSARCATARRDGACRVRLATSRHLVGLPPHDRLPTSRSWTCGSIRPTSRRTAAIGPRRPVPTVDDARTERAGDRRRRRSGQADRDPQQTGRRGTGPLGNLTARTTGCSRSCSRTRRSRCFGCG